ncbi:MAG: HlyD family efflux transporter periplasmic adaptor subunit, partial [Actinomycetota bacterium]
TVSGTVEKSAGLSGASVRHGDVLATVKTPEGDIVEITSPIDGTIVSLSTAEFALISAGSPVVTLAHNTKPMIGLIFVPSSAMDDVVPGLKVEVSPETTDLTQAGYIVGKVRKVAPLPVTVERLQLILGDTGQAQELLAAGPVQEVFVEFEQDPQGPLGLKWSSAGPAASDEITSGTIVEAKIVLRNQTPWEAFTGN